MRTLKMVFFKRKEVIIMKMLEVSNKCDGCGLCTVSNQYLMENEDEMQSRLKVFILKRMI